MNKFRISEAAKIKGVSPSTLRRWESEGLTTEAENLPNLTQSYSNPDKYPEH